MWSLLLTVVVIYFFIGITISALLVWSLNKAYGSYENAVYEFIDGVVMTDQRTKQLLKDNIGISKMYLMIGMYVVMMFSWPWLMFRSKK